MAIYIPEVFADAVNEKLGKTLRIGNLAFDATPLVSDITEMGSKVHFPQFSRTVTAGVVTKGTALKPDEIDMTDMTADIKQIGASVRIYDKDSIQIKGAVKEKYIDQVADAMADAIDTDLAKEMITNATKKSPTVSGTAITADELLTAMGLFGDDLDFNTFAGIVINSRLFPSMVKMEEFTNLSKSYGVNGNGQVENGLVGYWLGGIPVIVCNNETYDTTKAECITFMAKKDSLGLIKQKDVTQEEEREAKLFATDIVSSAMYATKIIDSDGVIVIRKTIA